MSEAKQKPIIYENLIDIRFADLDPYGHVNSRNYLDIVISSRWMYLERTLKITSGELIKKGLGFFLTKATMEFLKPIGGAAQVRVSSHVALMEGTRLEVPYEITNPDGSRVYSRGMLEFAVMDLTTRRPCPVPDWAKPMFVSAE